jgi:hypothetical protein
MKRTTRIRMDDEETGEEKKKIVDLRKSKVYNF